MRRRSGRRWSAAALALLAAGGCRDRSGPEAEAPPAIEPLERRVELRLYVAREWSWNDLDTLRVTAVNGTAGTVEGTLHLFVAAPAEPAGVPAGAATLSSGEGKRVSLPVRLGPGETAELRQAVRTPPAPGAAAADSLPRFPVRAWLAEPGGRELASRADTIRIRAGSAVVDGGCASAREAAVTRYGIGPLRLQMRAADLRALCPEARDTAWTGEGGRREAGLLVRISGVPVAAVLADDRVAGILVDSAGLTTPAGAGVGATLEELRARYGRGCAGVAEGRVVVRFPAAPGVGFALDTASVRPDGPAPDPDALPGDARVARLRVGEGTDDCPRAARSQPEPQEGNP
jgi:hypothetical protein